MKLRNIHPLLKWELGKFEQIIQDGVVWALTTMLGLTKEMRSLGMIGLCNIASHPLGRYVENIFQVEKSIHCVTVLVLIH